MRCEQNKDETWNVWMSREEYHELPRAAHSRQAEIALRLMGDSGLRVAETLDVQPRHISRMVDGKHHELEVVAGKDTTGEYEGGKQRRTWVPRDLDVQINRYIQENGLADDERLIDRKKRTVQNSVDHIGFE